MFKIVERSTWNALVVYLIMFREIREIKEFSDFNLLS